MTDIDNWMDNVASSPSVPPSPTLSCNFESVPSQLTPPPQSPQLIPLPSWDDICLRHDIPRVVSNLDDSDRMGVAYAYATRGVLRLEARLAEERYHRQIVVLKGYEQAHEKAQAKVSEIQKRLNKACHIANSPLAAAASSSEASSSKARLHESTVLSDKPDMRQESL